jgi:hypothetical protein
MTTGRINQVAIVPESRKTAKCETTQSSNSHLALQSKKRKVTHLAPRRSKPEFNQLAMWEHERMYLKKDRNTRHAHHNQPVVRIQLDEIHVNTARDHNQRTSLGR